jgi:hypothetical protein
MMKDQAALQITKKEQPIYYEEAVIFYHWLMFCKPRPIAYPINDTIWINVCSFGLRAVLEGFLLRREYEQWLQYRASAQQKLGKRFVEDRGCKNLRRSTDEQVESNRPHFNVF